MPQQSTEFTPGFGGLKFGSNFFSGVNPEPDVIVSKLMKGTSVSVFGPRRIGKSSLLAESSDCLQGAGRNVIWVDLDTNDSLVKSISDILDSMQQGNDKGLVASIKSWAEKSEIFSSEVKSVIGAIISGTFDSATENFDEKYAEALYRETGRQLKARAPDSKPIIIFDELTALLKNTIERADKDKKQQVVARLNSFLGLLRSWRNDRMGIAMAVSGSVSLNWLGRKYGIRVDSVNDCVPMKVRPMSREDARELVELCVKSQPPKNWNDELTEELLNMLPEYYPGVVQLAYEVIHSSKEISVELLNGEIRDKLNDAFWEQYFEQFHSRFANYGQSERCRAKKLFEAIEEQKEDKIEIKEVHKYLSESGERKFELDADDLYHYLISDSFIGFAKGSISYASGLVPAWLKLRP